MEPTGLRIPPAHRDALAALRSISEEHFELLLNNLAGVSPFAGASGLTDYACKTEGLTPDESQAVVLALLSLYAQLKFHGWTSEDLAVGVAHSGDLPESDADPSKLAHRLQTLLDLESVVTTGRALDLLTEHEHLIHSHALTDIRPVFGDDPKEPPSGALIIEALKVEYFDEEAPSPCTRR